MDEVKTVRMKVSNLYTKVKGNIGIHMEYMDTMSGKGDGYYCLYIVEMPPDLYGVEEEQYGDSVSSTINNIDSLDGDTWGGLIKSIMEKHPECNEKNGYANLGKLVNEEIANIKSASDKADEDSEFALKAWVSLAETGALDDEADDELDDIMSDVNCLYCTPLMFSNAGDCIAYLKDCLMDMAVSCNELLKDAEKFEVKDLG